MVQLGVVIAWMYYKHFSNTRHVTLFKRPVER